MRQTVQEAPIDRGANMSAVAKAVVEVHVLIAPGNHVFVVAARVEECLPPNSHASRPTVVIDDRGEDAILEGAADKQVLVLHSPIDVPGKAGPRKVVGVDVADDVAAAQPRRHVAGMAEAEELRVFVAVVDDASGGKVFCELGLDPAGQIVGRAVVEQHELEAGMIGVPGEILHQGLLEVMQPSHADGEE